MLRTITCLMLLGLLGCGGAAEPERAAQERERFQVLVFTKTTGYRHESIPDGVKAIQRLGRERGFRVDVTSDARRFTSLGRYEAVVFLSTTGTPIARAGQQRAFERYIRRGGGYVGVHAASDTRGRWPWYERLVGARFKRHDPGVSERPVRIEDAGAAATRGLPSPWERADEWYEFRTNPRGRVHVLASLDESRPLAWCHAYDGGRSVYTAMGHTRESFTEDRFLAHLYGAIAMAAGRARFACAP
jgi:type 1 glutamine amidotransferase